MNRPPGAWTPSIHLEGLHTGSIAAVGLARTLMIQGTASSAGKSTIVAGLCRHYANLGFRVAPFKSQNMALNSFATVEGYEIGRAQAVQARACRIEPRVDMNPILLKPEADHRSQVVVMGKPLATMEAVEYHRRKPELLGVVQAALSRLRQEFDLVIIEGAGSPAEVNLKDRDIVNMRVAEMAEAPVLLVGDIDRGGVFAALVGTLELLDPPERDRVKGLIVNKFRGDLALLRPGLEFIERRTAKPVLAVMPYIPELGLPEEDSVALDSLEPPTGDWVAVIKLPRIANFDDFDPLPVRYVSHPRELIGAKAIIIPGSKATAADLAWLRQQGFAAALALTHLPIVGICAGFQMLGEEVLDPLGVESANARTTGLGLLPVRTIFAPEKTTEQTRGEVLDGGFSFEGYQIHMGQTDFTGECAPFARIADGGLDGAVRGRVWGTYLHGIFHNVAFARHWLREIGIDCSVDAGFGGTRSAMDPYDRLAGILGASLVLNLLRRAAGIG